MAETIARSGRGVRFPDHQPIGMGMLRPGIVPDVDARDRQIGGTQSLSAQRQRRRRAAGGAPNTDLDRAPIQCSAHPRQRGSALTEIGAHLIVAAHRIGGGQGGLARDRNGIEKPQAATLRGGVQPDQEDRNDRPLVIILRSRTASAGAGPLPDDMKPIPDGVDAGQRAGWSPRAGWADARQGPAGLIRTAGARGTLKPNAAPPSAPRPALGAEGERRACSHVHCEWRVRRPLPPTSGCAEQRRERGRGAGTGRNVRRPPDACHRRW
jgi:hypothetical protein